MLTTYPASPVRQRLRDVLEYADVTASARVDEVNHVIRGVKVIGLRSVNGRDYKLDAIRRAAPMYEDAAVFVNHVRDVRHRRSSDYGERFGVLRGFVVKEDGGYADLHYNPHHPQAAQIIHDVKTAPRKLGLSHHADLTTKQTGKGVSVESIDKVYSVDIVGNPATTNGIFESVGGVGPASPGDRLREVIRCVRGRSAVRESAELVRPIVETTATTDDRSDQRREQLLALLRRR